MDKKQLKQQLDALPRGAQAALAAHLGYSASVTNKLINGPRRIMADEADKIREFFDNYKGGEQGGLPMVLPLRARPAPAAPVLVHPQASPDLADIPVWASASAGDEEGTIVLTDSPIDFIRRSELMLGVAKPFAFYIVGDSMLERFAQGDMGVINPSLPLRPMDDCVFIQHGEDGVIYGLVKRLLRATPDSWRVRQLNPHRDFVLPKAKWSTAYRIAETRHR